MSDEERIELFRVAKDQAKGRVPLLSGISAIATGSAVNLAAAAKDMGLDGALLLPPPPNRQCLARRRYRPGLPA